MNPQMTGNEKLWHAVALLPDEMIGEAITYVPAVGKKRPRRLLLAVAVAAALILIGCIAHTWLFAPGRGIIPAYTDMGVTVYATEERVPVGNFTLEAAVFTEDAENPRNNRLMFWWYCEDQQQMETWPRVRVNGELYNFSHYRMNVNSNLYCFTYIPQKREMIGPVQDMGEGMEFEIQLMNGDTPYAEYAEGESVTVPLTEAKSGSITQIWLDGEKYVSFLPLTTNVFVGNFHNPAAAISGNARDVVVLGDFTLRYADGAETELSGMLSMDGMHTREAGLMSDRYDSPLDSAVLRKLRIRLDYYPDAETAPVYSFPLMAVGETMECDVPVWQENGLEIRLTSVYRDETGLRCTTALRNGTDDPLITEGSASFSFKASPAGTEEGWSDSCSSHPDGTGEIVTNLRRWPDGSQTYDRILQEGETVHMLLMTVSYTYASPDGTPLGEIRFDGKG